MKSFLALFIIAINFPFNIFSQEGSPDLTFGDNGIVLTDINNNRDYVTALNQSPNGRIMVAGTTEGSDLQDFILAYSENGSLDESFGDNGLVLLDYNSGVEDLLIQQDEKVLVGNRNTFNYSIIRYLANGQVDTSFADNGYLYPFTDEEVKNAVVLTEDDKLLFSAYHDDGSIIIKRYLSHGVIDEGFGNNGSVSYSFGNESSEPIGKIELIENGRFVLGVKTVHEGITSNILIRFNSNGIIDTTYGEDGIITIPLDSENNCAPLVFENGNTLARCRYWNLPTQDYISTTIKFYPNGSIDENFGTNGVIDDYIGDIIQNNQRILDAEIETNFLGEIDLELKRYFSNGLIDPSFSFISNEIILISYEVILLNSGKLLVAGSTIWQEDPDDIILQQFNNNPLNTEEQQLDNFSIYPNPSNGIFKLQYPTINNETPYQITDITGKIILKGTFTNQESKINLSNYQSGVYLLITENSQQKLIKN